MGESYGRFAIGNDKAVFPFITSCNIACGFHGGDPATIVATIKSAIAHKCRIGAHPSYPDLSGFGRRSMQMSPADLKAAIKYQVSALRGMAESFGGRLRYVKPHGALYNTIARERNEALTVYKAIHELGADLDVMGLAGSHCAEIAAKIGIGFIAEAFADRRYTSDGKLLPRGQEGAVLTDPQEVARQVIGIITENRVISKSGKPVALRADSICIHGDNPNAVEILKAIDAALQSNNIKKETYN